MIHIRNFLIFFIILTSVCWADVTTEYLWVQVDQPFQETIKLPLYGQASLDLDIPAEYLTGEKYLTFRMFMPNDCPATRYSSTLNSLEPLFRYESASSFITYSFAFFNRIEKTAPPRG